MIHFIRRRSWTIQGTDVASDRGLRRPDPVVIGGLPINIQSANRGFIAMLEDRYAGFVAEPAKAGIRLDVEVVASVGGNADEDLEVRHADGRWDDRSGRLSRGLGSRQPARLRAPSRLSLCDRLRHAHSAQPGARGAGWLSGPFSQRGSQRTRISVLGCIGRGQDHHFAPRAA